MNYTGFSVQKVAEFVGQTSEHVWDITSRFTPHLDKLQQKNETITSAAPPDPEVTSEQYWRKVAKNLIDLAQRFDSKQQVRQLTTLCTMCMHLLFIIHMHTQVRAFLQLGKCSGAPSISVAATTLMIKKGITPKFTLDDLRDNITLYSCGSRGQSRRFHQLDRELKWHGSTLALKVPVINLKVKLVHNQHN